MKKILSIILLTLSFNFCAFSQDFCNTLSDIPDFLQSIPREQYVHSKLSDTYVIRIFFYIIRQSDGTGGQALSAIDSALHILQDDYQPHGICFELLGIDEIHNDSIYNERIFKRDPNGDGKFINFSPNFHFNAIDIYLFANNGRLSGGEAAGIPASALVIGGQNYNINFVTSHVLSHEVGHCLGLYHTFHGSWCEPSSGSCLELADGSNCDTCGDYVCDTPADPQANHVDQYTCEWDGKTCSIGGDSLPSKPSYNPRTDLIMAYIPPNCMQLHTTGQSIRMKEIIANSPILQKVVVPNTLTLLDSINGTNFYDAVGIITSTQVIESASISYKAGTEIVLQDGFHASSGSTFTAQIETLDCNGASSPLLSPQRDEDYNDIILEEFTPLSQLQIPHKINILPNPNSGTFQIETNFPLSEISNLKISNLIGTTIYETQHVTEQPIQLPNSTSGLFFVVIILKDGSVLTQKMVVQ